MNKFKNNYKRLQKLYKDSDKVIHNHFFGPDTLKINNIELIKCSAVKFPDNNLYIGKRHCDCFKAAKISGQKSPKDTEQGFLTIFNRFVDRKEAAKLALHSGQIKKLKYSDTELFSEDLY